MSEKLLKIKDVTEMFGVSRSTIYRWVNDEGFPHSKQLAANTVRWLESEITMWQQKVLNNDK